jgi:hypothetical protein
MKNKLLYITLFAGVLCTLISCQKEWICTCTAKSIIAGQPNLDIMDTIAPTVKPSAQADCDKFCSTYANNSSYTSPTSTIAKQ